MPVSFAFWEENSAKTGHWIASGSGLDDSNEPQTNGKESDSSLHRGKAGVTNNTVSCVCPWFNKLMEDFAPMVASI